ncbi:MAG: hypothetical protein ACK5LO_02390 [Leucobacter sp.]
MADLRLPACPSCGWHPMTDGGREAIPARVHEEIEAFEEYTATAVCGLATALKDARDPAVAVYRTDEQMHAARPDTAHLTARWWRHVAARACHEVPGVEIRPA